MIGKLKRLRSLIELARDFDYAESDRCVKGIAKRGGLQNLLVELTEREHNFLISLEEDFGRPYIGYGEKAATKAEALARLDILIAERVNAAIDQNTESTEATLVS